MRLLGFFLFVSFLHVSAAGVGQTVTLSLKNASLKKVFKEVIRQAGVSVMYDEELLKSAKPVSINVKDASPEYVLELCLKEQHLSFSTKGKIISIIPAREKNQRPVFADQNPQIDITGRVINFNSEPLSGATVVVKRTGKGTQTDVQGRFTLKNVQPDDELIVSYIGYKQTSVTISDRSEITIALPLALNELDAAVVQGYGTTTKRLATGNIARVTAEEIAKQPILNPLQALQGKVPGLEISQTNGYASAPFKVELRGRSTVGEFSTEPLYIIDGVPLTVVEVGGGNGYPFSKGFVQNGLSGPANGQSPFFNLNPADIESIEVLKDADATAIYGSRGANGVIIITTKKGKAGKTQFDVSFQQGITKVTRFWDMLNTEQYLKVRREAFANDVRKYGEDGQTVPNDDFAYDLTRWDSTRYTDWQKMLYGGTGRSSNIQANLSGGDANTTFRIGAGYNHTTNILAVSGADQKGSLSLNVTHKTKDNRLVISLSSAFNYSQSDMVSLPGTIVLPPNAPGIYDSKGNLNYEEWRVARNFPFAGLRQPYTSKTNFLNSNLNLNYQIIKGLSIGTSFGYNGAQLDQTSLNPKSAQDPQRNPVASAYFGNNSNKNWIVEPQINYETFLGKGRLSAMVGGSLQQTRTSGLSVYGEGYTDDALLNTISNATFVDGTENFGEYKYAAVFGRLNYNLSGKYLLNVNGRRDGSSRFGSGNQFGNFGSIGAAWIFSEEEFLKNALPFISYGKLRASYGTTGSDAIGDYGYLSRWSSDNLLPYTGIQPLAPRHNANPDYHWQVTKKLEGGLELGFMQDRLNVNIAYYLNRCGNQLIDFPTPGFSGFQSVIANSPALVQNSGWEFSASARIINGKDVNWSLSFNTSFNRNKLVAYPDLESSPYHNIYEVGQPLNITRRLHYLGVDPETGLYTFEDRTKDGQISTSPGETDDRYIFNLNPKFFGGLSSNFSYKQIQLGLVFNIKKQSAPNAISQGGNVPGTIFNQAVDVINSNRWQNPGDMATYAQFTTVPNREPSYSNYAYRSDAGFTDASFIRLSNAYLAYNLPESILKRASMQSCALTLSASNLFVITRYKGVDPETQNFGGLPPARVITAGIRFNF